MNLKETKLKQNRTVAFEAFCERKGLKRKKGLWETQAETETKVKELELEEMLSRKKQTRSKKKKAGILQRMQKENTHIDRELARNT